MAHLTACSKSASKDDGRTLSPELQRDRLEITFGSGLHNLATRERATGEGDFANDGMFRYGLAGCGTVPVHEG